MGPAGLPMRIGGLLVAVVAFAACSAPATSVAPSLSPSVPVNASTQPSTSGGTSSTPSATPSPSATPGPDTSTTESAPMLAITSDAFAEGGSIPSQFTCDGADTSPALRWTGTPAGAVSLALVIDDPDAGGFIHWVAYDLDPASGGLEAGVPAPDQGGPPQGRNSFGKVGYGGPCPPSGTHHYRFRLLALSARPSITGTPSAAAVLAAATGHILGEALLTGTYRRH